MNGPTWAEIASDTSKIETRDYTRQVRTFVCPFCNHQGLSRHLGHSGGHRCGCGALFSTSRPEAHHFKAVKP